MPNLETLVVAALLAIVPSLLYLAVLNAVDRYEKEPWTILLASLGLGAFLAPGLSIAALAVLGREATLLPQFAPGAGGADPVRGIVQELVKGGLLLILVHSIRDEFDDVLDGVVYGAAIGAGFAATETFVYALGGVRTLNLDTLAALLVAGLDHAFYAAAFGAVAGWARRLSDVRIRAVVTLYGLLTAALLHAFHDALPSILSRLVERPDDAFGLITRLLAQGINVLGIVTLIVVVWLAGRRESRVLQEQLAEEVDAGVVGREDYATITSTRARLARQRRLRRERGLDDVAVLRRLYALEGELAFHKYRLAVRRRRPPDESRTDALRDEIRSLRRRLGDLEEARA
jgi:RsiW-degrading membrane proteinase PrsW (M82 family)